MVECGHRDDLLGSYTDCSERFPELRDAVYPELDGIVLDGEVLAPKSILKTSSGLWTDCFVDSSYALTDSEVDDATQIQQRFGPATFNAFDLLIDGGRTTESLPFRDRRRRLKRIVKLLQERFPEGVINLLR
jgi:ATP-dependent DNA ligase